METILSYAMNGFWPFIGVFIFFYTLLFFVTNGSIRIFRSFMRMLMIRKHGWPPEYLDGDGDPN